MAIDRRNKNDQLSSEKMFKCAGNQEKANISNNEMPLSAHLIDQNFSKDR